MNGFNVKHQSFSHPLSLQLIYFISTCTKQLFRSLSKWQHLLLVGSKIGFIYWLKTNRKGFKISLEIIFNQRVAYSLLKQTTIKTYDSMNTLTNAQTFSESKSSIQYGGVKLWMNKLCTLNLLRRTTVHRRQKSIGLNTGFAIEWNPEHKYRTQV